MWIICEQLFTVIWPFLTPFWMEQKQHLVNRWLITVDGRGLDNGPAGMASSVGCCYVHDRNPDIWLTQSKVWYDRCSREKNFLLSLWKMNFKSWVIVFFLTTIQCLLLLFRFFHLYWIRSLNNMGESVNHLEFAFIFRKNNALMHFSIIFLWNCSKNQSEVMKLYNLINVNNHNHSNRI